jgi:hypothetical protein
MGYVFVSYSFIIDIDTMSEGDTTRDSPGVIKDIEARYNVE